jgi:hypothetical protein
MPKFERGDILEYVSSPYSIEPRIGSIAIVEEASPYDDMVVRWISPAWEIDQPGTIAAGILTSVFKRLTRASL